MADKPERPKVSRARARVVSRPMNREKAQQVEERRRRQKQARREAASFDRVQEPIIPVMSEDFDQQETVERSVPPRRGMSSRRPAQAVPPVIAPRRRPVPGPHPEPDEPAQYRVIRGGAGRKRAGLVALISAVAVVLVSVILVNSLAPAGLIELIETATAGFGTGNGFPQDIGATTDQSIATVGNSIAVLTDTSLLLYKNDGYKVLERQHGYSSPVLSASTSRMLVYDRGGTKLRVENAARSLGEITMDHAVITADLGYNGAFVVATRSSEHLCDVQVYNADLDKIYTWHSATRYVTSVSMADGGRQFAVGVLSVEAGEYVSHVLYFDCGSVEPVYTQEFRGSTVLSVDCKQGGRVVAVFDNMLSSLNRDGQHTDVPLEGQTLHAFDNHDPAGVAVSLTKYNHPQNAELVLFDASLKKCGGGQTEGVVQSVSMSGRRVCVLLRDRMVVFDNKGVLLGKVEVDSDSLLVANTNSRACVVGSAKVGQYDITRFAAVKS